ncbi:hypothetical protein Pint_28901 [Pistacia integerrima]|uniref:Uncharacterized protein n=1 Tax=Pistacia integerrima TaxID=434235 RepID=A0ACC0X048_9ROSI|nr:hypothetical protein Pint_28901 [Pistacia integerrima]
MVYGYFRVLLLLFEMFTPLFEFVNMDFIYKNSAAQKRLQTSSNYLIYVLFSDLMQAGYAQEMLESLTDLIRPRQSWCLWGPFC